MEKGWVGSWEPLSCSSGSAVAQLHNPWKQNTAQLLTFWNQKWCCWCFNFSAILDEKCSEKAAMPAGTWLAIRALPLICFDMLWVTADESFSAHCIILNTSCNKCLLLTAYIHSNQIMGWGEKAIEIRSVETGHLDGVFMHKRAQRLKFLCERNDKVSPLQSLYLCCELQGAFRAYVWFVLRLLINLKVLFNKQCP